MKEQLFAAMLIFSLLSCEQPEDYKVVRREVVEEHDRVMLDSDRAAANRVKLEHLLLHLDSLKQHRPDLDTVQTRAELSRLRQQLKEADITMETWMKEFDAELGNKSNKEAVAYFNNEKLKLRQMDTLFNALLRESDESLQRY